MKKILIAISILTISVIAVTMLCSSSIAQQQVKLKAQVKDIGYTNIMVNVSELFLDKKQEILKGGFVYIPPTDYKKYPYLAKLNKTWIIDAFSQPYLKCFIDSGFGHPYILKIFPPGSTGVSNVNSIAENMLLNE